MKNEYERLKEQGYTEKEIKVKLGDISNVSVKEEPIGNSKEGEERHDLGVVVSDGEKKQKTSSIMTGYEKLQIEDGSYISEEELLEAVIEEINKNEEDVIIVNRRLGKRVSTHGFWESIVNTAEQAGKIVLSEGSEKVTNQETKTISVNDNGQDVDRGLLFLGKDKIQLPNGDYISEEEIKEAISDYCLMVPGKKKQAVPANGVKGPKDNIPTGVAPNPSVPNDTPKDPTKTADTNKGGKQPRIIPTGPANPKGREPASFEPQGKQNEETEDKKITVKRTKKTRTLAPLVIAGALAALSFIPIPQVKYTPAHTEVIEHKVKETDIDYDINGKEEEKHTRKETNEEIKERTYKEIDNGEKVDVNNGVKYHESSDYDSGGANKTGTFKDDGSSIRKPGEYEIEGFSILVDGEIKEVSFKDKDNLAKEMQEFCKENNVDIKDANVRIHLGGPVSGWVDVNDIIDKKDLKPQDVIDIVKVDHSYNGTVKDFNGDTITIQTNKGNVDIPVKDENGNYYKTGDIVTVNGEEYRFDNLDIKNVEKTEKTEKQVDSSIKFSIGHLPDGVRKGMLGMSLITALTPLIPIKEEEKKKMTEKEFVKAKRDFLKSSKFNTAYRKGKNKVVGYKFRPVLLTAEKHELEAMVNYDVEKKLEAQGEVSKRDSK